MVPMVTDVIYLAQSVRLIRGHELWIAVRGLQGLQWRLEHGLQTPWGPLGGPRRGAVERAEQSHQVPVDDLLRNCPEGGKNKYPWKWKRIESHWFDCTVLYLSQGEMVNSVQDTGIVDAHAYSVTAVTEVKFVLMYVQEESSNVTFSVSISSKGGLLRL